LSKLCPHCRLPLLKLGRVITATSNDGLYSAVIGLCRRCTLSYRNHPKPLRDRQAAIERALNEPGRYLCTIYADPGTARLAMAMLSHNELSSRTLAALGWIPDGCDGLTCRSPDTPARLRHEMTISPG
jgi:hypothetical protein